MTHLQKWKTLLNSKMNSYLETVWEQEIYSKKSLKYLNPRSVTVGKLHMCWSSVRHNVRDNRRAELKVKVLTGAYILQANRSCFNQYAVDPSCKLCQKEPEDREHFIARCDSLEHVRKPYRQKFNMIFNNIIPSQSIDSIVLPNWFWTVLWWYMKMCWKKLIHIRLNCIAENC